MKSPFSVPAPKYYPHCDEIQYICADDRLRMVREMNPEQLREVLAWPGVQRTVLKAARARLARLEKKAKRLGWNK